MGGVDPFATALNVLPASVVKKRAVRVTAKSYLRVPFRSGVSLHEPDWLTLDAAVAQEAEELLQSHMNMVRERFRSLIEESDPAVGLDGRRVLAALMARGAHEWIRRTGLGNTLWAIAVAGGGTSSDLVPDILDAVVQVQATRLLLDTFANRPHDDFLDGAPAFDRDGRFSPARLRMDWAGQIVLRALAPALEWMVAPDVLTRGLYDYILKATTDDTEHGWMGRNLELDTNLRTFFAAISIDQGSLKRMDPHDLLEGRELSTNAIVRFGDRLAPLSARALAKSPHVL